MSDEDFLSQLDPIYESMIYYDYWRSYHYRSSLDLKCAPTIFSCTIIIQESWKCRHVPHPPDWLAGFELTHTFPVTYIFVFFKLRNSPNSSHISFTRFIRSCSSVADLANMVVSIAYLRLDIDRPPLYLNLTFKTVQCSSHDVFCIHGK